MAFTLMFDIQLLTPLSLLHNLLSAKQDFICRVDATDSLKWAAVFMKKVWPETQAPGISTRRPGLLESPQRLYNIPATKILGLAQSTLTTSSLGTLRWVPFSSL